jgi:hypothetical protein
VGAHGFLHAMREEGGGMKTLKKTPKPTALKLPAMAPVKSSNILAIGYDEATQSLHVTFKGGGHYSYSGVQKALHAEMLKADSVGSFFHSKIKANKDFKFTKIETEKKEEHPHGTHNTGTTEKG